MLFGIKHSPFTQKQTDIKILNFLTVNSQFHEETLLVCCFFFSCCCEGFGHIMSVVPNVNITEVHHMLKKQAII